MTDNDPSGKIMRAWPRTRIDTVDGVAEGPRKPLKPHTINLINLIRHGCDTELVPPVSITRSNCT